MFSIENILSPLNETVNVKTQNCTNNNDLEKISISDLLENIKILLDYIIKKRNFKYNMQTLKLTKKYEKYPEYKDSGVDWLGKIPKDWNSFKLRNVLRSNIVDGPHETPKYVEEGIPFVSVDSIEDTENVNLDVVKKFITDDQYREYNKKTKLTKKDILFTKAASIGRVAIVDDRKFMTWSPLAIIKPEEKSAYYKYLFYVFKSNKFVESVVNSCSFNTQLNIGMKVLEKSIIGVPKDLLEQQKIADYLDEKTKNIDQIIEKKQKLIELLTEKRTAVINNAVTKGLDGKLVLNKWRSYKIKYLYNFQSGDGFPDNLQGGLSGEVPFLKVSDINGSELFIKTSNNYVTREQVKNKSWHLIPENSILMAKIGAALTKNHRKINSIPVCIDNNMMAMTPKNILNQEFAYWLSRIIDMADYQNISSVPSIDMTQLKNSYFKVPQISVQKEIVEHLKLKLPNFDIAIKKVEESIVQLKEFKSSLISNVVTGKIKV